MTTQQDRREAEIRAVLGDIRYLCERIAKGADSVYDLKQLKRIQGRLCRIIEDFPI